MPKIITEVNATIYLELTEGEAGALQAIVGYGPDEFLKWFERNLGKHYIAPYRDSVKSLFIKARKLETAVNQLKEAKKQIRVIEC